MSGVVGSFLLGDIGATNARFGLLSKGNLAKITSFEVARFAQFRDVLGTFIKQRCRHIQIRRALLAIAGPVKDERVVLTNSSWVVDAGELQKAFGLQVRVVNDFEAVAYSLPSLTPADLTGIGGGRSEAGAPMAVLKATLHMFCCCPRSHSIRGGSWPRLSRRWSGTTTVLSRSQRGSGDKMVSLFPRA